MEPLIRGHLTDVPVTDKTPRPRLKPAGSVRSVGVRLPLRAHALTRTNASSCITDNTGNTDRALRAPAPWHRANLVEPLVWQEPRHSRVISTPLM